ncbi:hypothetical protein BgiMline_023622 [Biomphalaria glabrata]
MNEEIETRSKHHGKSNLGLTSAHSLLPTVPISHPSNKYSLAKICLAYSCTAYQQMLDGLSGSSLNTMKITTLSLTSKHSVANSTHLSSYPSN